MDDSDVATFIYIVSGINETIEDCDISIDSHDGTIIITGAEGATCHIYNIQGMEVSDMYNLRGQERFKVMPDIYLVCIKFKNGQTIVNGIMVK